jgi:2-dehydropantoate 2-reductase
MMKREPILVAGTGAMACLFAARLAPITEVTLLGTWAEGIAALQKNGVRLLEANGAENVLPVRATSDPRECVEHRFALVLVKSWQTERAARQLRECLNPDGVALTLQNGLGNLERLQEILGEDRAALGVTTTGATLLGPGYVRAGGKGPTHISIHSRLESLIDLLREVGFEVEIADDLDGLVWGKLAINAAINPLTALLGVTNGELPKRADALALMIAAAQETVAVASKRGVRIPFDDLGATAVDVAHRTASNRSSMLQDVTRGAPTEIDAICGAIFREGERLGVHTPVNWVLWHLIRAKFLSTQENADEGRDEG